MANANGKLSLCDKVAKQLGIRVQDHVVGDDFYVFPMRGLPHIVLGVQWLFSLGEIYSNYQMLEMRFKANGK